MEIYNQVVFTSLVLSSLITIALFFKSKSNKLSNKVLAIHMVLTSLFVLDVYININDFFLLIPNYFRVFTPFQYLILPALYYHVRLLLFPEKRISKIDLIWFAPVLFQIIDLMPFYFSGRQEKIELLNKISINILKFQPQNEGFFFPAYFHSYMKIMLAIVCDMFIAKNLIEYYKKRSAIDFNNNKLIWSVVIFSISLIFQSLPYIVSSINLVPYQIALTSSMSIGVIVLSVYLIFTPGLLYDEIYSIKKNNKSTNKQLDDNDFYEKDDDKFDIDEETCENYKNMIIETMIDKGLYKSNDCSLGKISEATNIPAHHISIVMKKCVNKRFNDFVDELRIDDIINEIENRPDNNLTIEGLSNNYGFNSKSTFYRAFKKYKGSTPKEFFKNQQV